MKIEDLPNLYDIVDLDHGDIAFNEPYSGCSKALTEEQAKEYVELKREVRNFEMAASSEADRVDELAAKNKMLKKAIAVAKDALTYADGALMEAYNRRDGIIDMAIHKIEEILK